MPEMALETAAIKVDPEKSASTAERSPWPLPLEGPEAAVTVMVATGSDEALSPRTPADVELFLSKSST